MKPLWVAIRFLTILPAPGVQDASARVWGWSAVCYPLVGLLAGGLLFAAQRLTGALDPVLQAALLLMLWVGLTGGLHLDGLADCADAWVGGHGNREKTLAIMKDPNCGPNGVVALVLLLMLKFAALVALIRLPGNAAWILAPVLGRAALLVLFVSAPYARAAGLASALLEDLPRHAVGLVLVLTGVLAVVAFGSAGGAMLAGALAMLAVVRAAALRRLGGATGDVYGACVELVEVTSLVALALWLAA
jgi:adenosylcobinamide-GDP ribazoletransferase